MAQLDKCIIDKCKESWEEEFIKGLKNRDNCSGFVKAVAKKLGIKLKETANADEIVNEITESWRPLNNNGKEAAATAATGTLVIAGLRSKDHKPVRSNGHVVIIVSGALYRDMYPRCWGGSTGNAQSRGDKSVGEVWNRTDRDNVAYFAYAAT